MSGTDGLEENLLHPKEAWYYNLLTRQVTDEPGQDRMGPYASKEEAEHALEIAQKRNEEWADGERTWNGDK